MLTMENIVKLEEMIKKEPEEIEDLKNEVLTNMYVKEETHVHIEFEGIWNYHNLKEEERDLDNTEDKKMEEDEKDGRIPKIENLTQEESHGGMDISSPSCSSSFYIQERNLCSSTRPSWSRAKLPKSNTIRYRNDSSAQKNHRKKLTKKFSYYCDECDASFFQNSGLTDHKRLHTGERPFHCNECDSTFTQKCNLTVHMRKHTGHRPFHCNECDASFTRFSSLTTHMRKHTGERPFHCKECGSTFTQKCHLTVHMRKHTGHRPYHCNECGATFTCKGILAVHMRKHNAHRPFHFNECDASFAQFSSTIH